MKSLIHQLRMELLPPESPQELFLRTIYHRIYATHPFIAHQMRLAKRSYSAWKRISSQIANSANLPEAGDFSVTFLLTVMKNKENEAAVTIESLVGMGQRGWKVVPILDAEVNWENVLRKLAGISALNDLLLPVAKGPALLSALKSVSTEFVVFCSAGDLFYKYLPAYLHAEQKTNPLGEVYYFDCEYQDPLNGAVRPFFKPSALSPELMLSVNYLSRGFIRTRKMTDLLFQSDEITDEMGFEYRLLSTLIQEKASILHIPAVLARLHEPEFNPALDGEIKKLLQRQVNATVSTETRAGNRWIQWKINEPKTSLIILNRNHGNMLRALLQSIFTLTDYSNYEICIVDNGSTEREALLLYAELEKDPRFKLIPYDAPFNYSTAVNTGVEHSDGEIIVILNNDMLITQPDWLSEMVRWACQPEIGVVGAKLLHKNRSIQHAGIILGMNGFIGHLYLNAPEHYHGLAGSADWYRNFYALTGACQAMRRNVFNQVGGYDPRFRLAFGDIDFCLRVIKEGFRNLYTPFAQLIHFEGSSRGYSTPTGDILFGYHELKSWLEADDPYFSPNLTYTPIPKCNTGHGTANDRLERIEQRKRSIQAHQGK
ncbi:MAG TPA: glycosyltransferase family 2 protein [Anaerolineaceae bacterium]|nr:glycosyltransferase family 2 protein [Anaerolineaceae bacterium]